MGATYLRVCGDSGASVRERRRRVGEEEERQRGTLVTESLGSAPSADDNPVVLHDVERACVREGLRTTAASTASASGRAGGHRHHLTLVERVSSQTVL